jgi:GcrA cell cycle regulator
MMLIGTSPTEKFKWTDERVAEFRDKYALGWSHSQLGAHFGVSRNASIGKAHRLGLQGQAPPRKPKPWVDVGVSERTWHRRQAKASHRASQGQGGASKDKPAYHRNRSLPAHSFVPVTFGRYATDLEPEAIANPVTLMELQEHHCHWPHDIPGEPMMYCGADSVLGLSYCPRHCRMAYVAPRRISERHRMNGYYHQLKLMPASHVLDNSKDVEDAA